MNIGINEFVLRQTPESKFSHFEGTWEELKDLVVSHAENANPGYRDGVKLVPVPPERFRTSIIKIDEDTPLQATFGYRREGEQSHLGVVSTGGKKQQAKNVFIVLYHRDVLLEDPVDADKVGPEDWQILSINASPTEEEVPFQPLAWARNVAGLEGGTDPELESKSKEELIQIIRDNAKAHIWWSQHVMIEPLKADTFNFGPYEIVTDGNGGGGIHPADPEDEKNYNSDEDRELNAAMDGLECFILALACAGVKLSGPQFSEALTTANDAIANSYG